MMTEEELEEKCLKLSKYLIVASEEIGAVQGYAQKKNFVTSSLREIIDQVRLEEKNKIKDLESKLKIAEEGLNDIACWREGPIVNSSFDEPESAEQAREVLEKMGVKL